MSDRIKEWDEYFGIHCHLPAAAIRDLFDEIERLEMELMACGDARGIEGMRYEEEIERLRAALERIATKPPVNEEYGNQGYDADEMQAMADAALQEGE